MTCGSPDKLAVQLAAFEHDPDLDVVFGYVEEFCTEDVSDGLRRARTRTVPGYLPSTMMVRRSSFARVGEFDPRLRAGELLDWIDRGRRVGLRIEMLPAVVARRRLHGANIGLREPQSRTDFARAAHAALRRRRGEGGDGSERP